LRLDDFQPGNDSLAKRQKTDLAFPLTRKTTFYHQKNLFDGLAPNTSVLPIKPKSPKTHGSFRRHAHFTACHCKRSEAIFVLFFADSELASSPAAPRNDTLFLLFR
jgi:hypothetical protein